MSTRKVNGRMIEEMVHPLGYAPPAPLAGGAFRSTVVITRPANQTPYASGDVIGDVGGSAIVAFSGIGPSGGIVQIEAARLVVHSGTVPTGLTADSLRLHLYATAPGAIADNAAWNLPAGDREGYLDYLTLPALSDFGDTLFSRLNGAGLVVKLASGSTTLHGVLVTTSGVTFAENSTVLSLRLTARGLGA